MKHAWIIAVGTELTLGQTVDTNSAWLGRQLAELGIRTTRHLTVPDELEPVRDAVTQAAGGADVIIVTGGLGPTADDLTRQAVAAAAGDDLVQDAVSLEQMRAFFVERGRPMPEPNLVQALRPRSATALPNTCGTAPGIAIELYGTPCYVLPGVPSEMEAMFAREVAPRLAAAARGGVLLYRRVQTFGLPESELGARLGELMARGRNPEVGTTASVGVIGVRINSFGDTRAAAQRLADETEAEVRRRLGDAVFATGDTTLAAAVGQLLLARGATLAVAESCTGGLIAKELTDVPGSSAYFAGGVVAYANALKTSLVGVDAALLAADGPGAVSAPVAEALAVGVRRVAGTTFGIGMTGIAGPTGGSDEKPVGLVFIGVATPGGARVERFLFGGSHGRELIRERAARTALNLLRLTLLAGGGV